MRCSRRERQRHCRSATTTTSTLLVVVVGASRGHHRQWLLLLAVGRMVHHCELGVHRLVVRLQQLKSVGVGTCILALGAGSLRRHRVLRLQRWLLLGTIGSGVALVLLLLLLLLLLLRYMRRLVVEGWRLRRYGRRRIGRQGGGRSCGAWDRSDAALHGSVVI